MTPLEHKLLAALRRLARLGGDLLALTEGR